MTLASSEGRDAVARQIHRLVKNANKLKDIADLAIDNEVARFEDLPNSCGMWSRLDLRWTTRMPGPRSGLGSAPMRSGSARRSLISVLINSS